MKSRRFYLLSSSLLCIVFLQGFISAQTPSPSPETTPVPETLAAEIPSENSRKELNLVHPGDLVDVDVIGSTEYDWRATLTPEGFLEGGDYIENPISPYAVAKKKSLRTLPKHTAKFCATRKLSSKFSTVQTDRSHCCTARSKLRSDFSSNARFF
jgi:hypothetical protein